MRRFVIVVLDGFGVGQMADVAALRPSDLGAHTCLHLFEAVPDLRLPTLQALGLGNIVPALGAACPPAHDAIFGRAMLVHDGADTFYGHQEIMGTNPKVPFIEPIARKLDAIEALLRQHGHSVTRHTVEGRTLLVVDGAVTVADNIECDPGQAFNITAAIDDIPFPRVLDIGKLVRSVSVVPRVIAFGGRGVHLEQMLGAIEVHGEYIGVNAPASGVYNEDYHCIHLGYGVNPQVQVPTLLGGAGVPVFLLGKVADVVQNEFGVSIPMVSTADVLAETARRMQAHPTGFFCVNVQETDLCGHRENFIEYAKILRIADRGIATLLDTLDGDDILIVMADHGNDPGIGHPHHTREMVPLMVRGPVGGPIDLGVRATLSDVGATAADYFGVTPPEHGTSFLHLIGGAGN